jgi:hypothetical protein
VATTNFRDKYALATDKSFLSAVQMAAIAASIDLLADPATDTRLAHYCSNVLNSPATFAANLAFGVAINSAISAQSSDSDLQWTVNSLMRAYAGVLPSPT